MCKPRVVRFLSCVGHGGFSSSKLKHLNTRTSALRNLYLCIYAVVHCCVSCSVAMCVLEVSAFCYNINGQCLFRDLYLVCPSFIFPRQAKEREFLAFVLEISSKTSSNVVLLESCGCQLTCKKYISNLDIFFIILLVVTNVNSRTS